MTPRDHYNYIYPIIMEQDFNDIYADILECESFDEIKPLYKKLYDTLIEEIEKDRGNGNFYEPYTKEQQFKEYRSWQDEWFITNANDKLNNLMKLDHMQDLSTTIYDGIIVEKIRTYAYEVYQKGGINDYVQLASDIQDCYLEDLKNEGVYDEFKGAEYADVPTYIGDQGKLDLTDKELDLTPDPKNRAHVEKIVQDADFQELLDDILDALESDDIEYVKGMLCAQHNDYFKTLAENYCYKNGLPIEMAEDIDWEFNKQEVKDEEDGLDDYEIKYKWVRDEFDNGDNE